MRALLTIATRALLTIATRASPTVTTRASPTITKTTARESPTPEISPTPRDFPATTAMSEKAIMRIADRA
ncbi:hypothetical protein BD626DRAFT_247665 [Schizophyllum amplum]|uniref:Secreted protein n=1 Tax=Schizophyllum amplum TaxID=97359 RepID=A0A550BVD0_9AGAR|nr:hypothetical protein BD626DRAFT_247665 [Auriculariopsis ampla]